MIIIELDELWTFVGSKEEPRWIWLAVSAQSSQVVSFALGHRDEKTCRQMYDKIPRFYGLRQKCTDCYGVYENVIP